MPGQTLFRETQTHLAVIGQVHRLPYLLLAAYRLASLAALARRSSSLWTAAAFFSANSLAAC